MSESSSSPPSSLAWSLFGLIVALLFFFDILVLQRGKSVVEIDPKTAVKHCSFWLLCGLSFNVLVFYVFDRNMEIAMGWLNGYVLEYMLSMDNLFFFQVVFKYYKTPRSQVYRALFWGILIAALCRLVFFKLGTEVFRWMYVARYFFGALLIYSGIKTAVEEDDPDEDPRNNKLVQFVTRHVPVVNRYDESGAFSILVEEGDVSDAHNLHPSKLGRGASVLSGPSNPFEEESSVSSSEETMPHVRKKTRKATLIVLVILCLGVIDIVFAIDSVTAKISQFDHLFVNFSSSVLAMFTLRSLYFLIVYLSDAFHLLKYGIALILVFVGLRLLFGSYLEISNSLNTALVVGIFFLSIFFSLLVKKPEEEGEKEMEQLERGNMSPESYKNEKSARKDEKINFINSNESLATPGTSEGSGQVAHTEYGRKLKALEVPIE